MRTRSTSCSPGWSIAIVSFSRAAPPGRPKPGMNGFPYFATPNTELQTVAQSIEVAASPDEVWSLIGDFGGAWHPLTARVGVIGTGIGQLRTIATLDGREIVERLEAVDNVRRCFRYTSIAGMPVSHYTGTLEVKPNGSGSVVDWRTAIRGATFRPTVPRRSWCRRCSALVLRVSSPALEPRRDRDRGTTSGPIRDGRGDRRDQLGELLAEHLVPVRPKPAPPMLSRLVKTGLGSPEPRFATPRDGHLTPDRREPAARWITMRLTINGKTHRVDVPADMPLLWVLRDVIGLTGTKFGCGIAACGACTVHLEGRPIRSCATPVAYASPEGRSPPSRRLGRLRAGRKSRMPGLRWTFPVRLLPIRPGHVGHGAAGENPNPSDADIDAAMSGNICRCGTYGRIRAAIKQAAGTALVAARGASA